MNVSTVVTRAPRIEDKSRDKIQGDQKVFVHLMITVQKTNIFLTVSGGHHRMHSECGPCYTEHGLREQSGDWWGTLSILPVTFCIVIIRYTETF
jgi:hypothetical protein